MEGYVLRFLRAEWKVSDTGSAQCWASSLNKALMWVEDQLNGCNQDNYYDNLTFLSLF
jgi:hypothetical protein